jgi:hypothetical protein
MGRGFDNSRDYCGVMNADTTGVSPMFITQTGGSGGEIIATSNVVINGLVRLNYVLIAGV